MSLGRARLWHAAVVGQGNRMDERIAQFRVGVLVLATIIVAAILIARFGNSARDRPGSVHDLMFDFNKLPVSPWTPRC